MSETFPGPDHDHAQCLEVAVSRAREVCENKGIKFTKLRERVFKTIAGSHKAVGAYDLIELLAEDGKKIAPISMYRILEALSDIGLIHRLESRNSYFACHSGHEGDTHRNLVFLICKICDTVVEMEASDMGNAVEEAAHNANFQLHEALLEIAGLCRHCKEL